MNKNLVNKSKTSVIWDISGSLLRQLTFLFITIALKRLLTPEEFGVVALAMVFIAISEVFIDAGFTSGLIQQKNTQDITYCTIFYFNILISLFFSTVLIFLSPYIANYFKKEILENVLYLLALIPPIAALGRVQYAILVKEINFKRLTIRDLISTFIGGILGLIAAFKGFGVYSLVIQQIVMIAINTIILWFSSGWYPKLKFSFNELKQLFSFSSYVFLDDLIRRVAMKIDTLFVGKVFSPTILGYYSNAETLKAQVETYTSKSVGKVMFPVLSQLQDDNELFLKTYFKVFNVVTGLIVLIIGPVCFLSYFIITTLFGEKWTPSVILFKILILSAIFAPHIQMMAKAILAKGLSKLKFRIGIVQRLFRLLPIAVGLFYGIQEFTIAVVASVILVFLLFCIILQNVLNINFFLHLKHFIIPNILLILFLIVNFSYQHSINQWLITLIFIPSQLLYLKLLRHDSLSFLINIIQKVLRRNNNNGNKN